MRIRKASLAPQSEIGRVIVAVLIAVIGTIVLLEWAPPGDGATTRPAHASRPARPSP